MTVQINTNYLSPSGFNVVIQKLPTVAFFAKSVNIPGISVNNPYLPTPFNPVPQPADTANHALLSFTFNVDEDLKNWIELYAWLIGMTFPEDYIQWTTFIGANNSLKHKGDAVYSDITVQTLTSAKNPNVEITYHNCIIRSMGNIELRNDQTDITPVECSATFDYSHFSINKI